MTFKRTPPGSPGRSAKTGQYVVKTSVARGVQQIQSTGLHRSWPPLHSLDGAAETVLCHDAEEILRVFLNAAASEDAASCLQVVSLDAPSRALHSNSSVSIVPPGVLHIGPTWTSTDENLQPNSVAQTSAAEHIAFCLQMRRGNGEVRSVELPPHLVQQMAHLLSGALANQVMVVGSPAQALSPEKAAKLLGVSRPYVLHLLNTGQLAELPRKGTHRQINLQALQAFKASLEWTRREAAIAMQRLQPEDEE